jgi:hypothetical protein
MRRHSSCLTIGTEVSGYMRVTFCTLLLVVVQVQIVISECSEGGTKANQMYVRIHDEE